MSKLDNLLQMLHPIPLKSITCQLNACTYAKTLLFNGQPFDKDVEDGPAILMTREDHYKTASNIFLNKIFNIPGPNFSQCESQDSTTYYKARTKEMNKEPWSQTNFILVQEKEIENSECVDRNINNPLLYTKGITQMREYTTDTFLPNITRK